MHIAVEMPPIKIVIDSTIEASSPEPCLIFGAKWAGMPSFVSSIIGNEGLISCILSDSMILKRDRRQIKRKERRE